MKGILLLTCVGLLAACSYDNGPYRTLSGDYDKGVPVVKEGSDFEVFYSSPPRPYQTVGFVSLTGASDLLPELHRLAAGRGANAAVITSQRRAKHFHVHIRVWHAVYCIAYVLEQSKP